MLQHSLRVLSHRGSSALLAIGFDPADVLAPSEPPLLQAMPASVQPLCTATPAQQQDEILVASQEEQRRRYCHQPMRGFKTHIFCLQKLVFLLDIPSCTHIGTNNSWHQQLVVPAEVQDGRLNKNIIFFRQKMCVQVLHRLMTVGVAWLVKCVLYHRPADQTPTVAGKAA